MKKILLVCLLIALPLMSSAQRLTITVPPMDSDDDQLILDLLRLSLRAEGINTEIQTFHSKLSPARAMEKVISGEVDLMWAGMKPDMEERMKPIRVPIFKGILGHRLFVINRKNQSKFSGIRNLDDLKRLEAGSGKFWGDTAILESAGIPVVKTVKGINLWPMLDGDRYDYLPLAVHQPWSEIASRPEFDLMVERNVLLVYPFAMYFYVGPNNYELHGKIFNGMKKAIADGSYDQLLLSHKIFKAALETADLPNRTVIRIGNPFMHPDTPVDVPEFWLNVTN